MTGAGTKPKSKGFWDALLRIPRPVIFLFVALAVAIPLFAPFGIRPLAMEPVVSLFQAVDSLPVGRALVLSLDYTPDTEAELQPMAIALLRHAFARRIKVGVLTLALQGIGLADTAIRQVVSEFNARARTPAESLRYGVDYVFWGFQTPYPMVMMGMGDNIAKVFPVDGYKNRTDTLPISRELRSYSDVGLLISLAASDLPRYWMAYAQTVFRVKMATGVTAVSAADYYPYYSKTRQFAGLLAGMKGAAEYEEVVEQHYPQTAIGIRMPNEPVRTSQGEGILQQVDLAAGTAVVRIAGNDVRVPVSEVTYSLRRRGTESMSAQTVAHIAIMLLIVIGNVAFFAVRRKS